MQETVTALDAELDRARRDARRLALLEDALGEAVNGLRQGRPDVPRVLAYLRGVLHGSPIGRGRL